MLMYLSPSRLAALIAARESSGICEELLRDLHLDFDRPPRIVRARKLNLLIWPTLIPFSCTSAFSAMPAESCM